MAPKKIIKKKKRSQEETRLKNSVGGKIEGTGEEARRQEKKARTRQPFIKTKKGEQNQGKRRMGC